ncbi:ATP-grasp domain-containing protein [Actinobaculum sp. 352]|uniref:carboxylate--amine ligase n=1 Tax=Actinobaculum sp. 352 TaxID=2490946 RepID=UPI000F7D892B|nr:ATP-grasp domain-containing protein [Actinobaculum sp. 352]RTE48793.1 ATP-grasp domain-containing protein [Actinobaculum sp. 352]
MIGTEESASQLLPVVIGYDIATYSFARIFHEAAGLRSLVISDAPRGPINDSRILDVLLVPHGTFDDDAQFLRVLQEVAADHPTQQLILLVNADEHVEFVANHRDELKERYFLPYATAAAVRTANSKQAMADLLGGLRLSVPMRTAVDLSDPQGWSERLTEVTFPVVVKPESGSELAENWNQGLRKVSVARTREDAMALFTRWHDNNIRTRLIVQELIPGDDTTQWVVNGYVDRTGRITACGSGRVLLGLHQPEYLGNAGIILLERRDDLIADAKRIVQAVGLRGFFSLDVKVDPRNGSARWLDLNPRIGRGHYYLKVGGVDLASAMLSDLRGLETSYQTNTREGIFCIVPAFLANRRYVRDAELLRRVRRTRLRRRPINPLAYSADRSVRRTIYRLGNGFNQWRRMRRWYPRPTDSGF